MSMSAEASKPQVSLRRLGVVRAAAVASLLSILVPWYFTIVRDFEWEDRIALLVPILLFPLWLPYAWVFRRLRSNTDTRAIKTALAVSLSWGSFLLLLASFLLIETLVGIDVPSVGLSFFVLLQVALLVAAIAAYYSMERQSEDLRTLVTQLWLPIACIMVAAIVLPRFPLTKPAPPEASAVGALHTIKTAQTQYATMHPDKGFASSLGELGPSGSDLIDSVLASGRKSQYAFSLSAAPPDSEGRIAQYTVIARPQEYRKDLRRSFFMDESGVLRFATENRAPTSKDPLLQ